jgi:DNA polymerase-3 subunit beta
VKVTCKQQDLAKGLSTVGHAVSTRSTLPILSHILVSTESDALRLSATNLEIGITCRVPATVEQEGTTTVPARLFSDFVNNLPSDRSVELVLQPNSQSLKVSGQRSQATIRGMDPTEFPAIPSADDSETGITLDCGALRAMITLTSFAAATDDARPVFTGVLARVRDNVLTFAAADSFRLAVMRTAIAASDAAAGDVLIPARTLTELARILPSEGDVRMVVTPGRNQVLFQALDAGEVKLVSNLLAGQFPNFEAILPKSSATHVNVPLDTFRQAAKTASLFARDSANIVRLKIEAGANDGLMPAALTLEATAEELGDTTTTLDGQEEVKVDGPGLEIIFNVKYLTDVLGVMDGDRVLLELNSPQQPGVVKSAAGDDYVYVIMPMHNTR